MSVAEGISVSRLLPSEAEAAAGPVRELLTSAYGRDLLLPEDYDQRLRAAANDEAAIVMQRAEIRDSGDLANPCEDAFIVATKEGVPKYENLEGVGKISRLDDDVVAIGSIIVRPGVRRQRVATRIVSTALQQLKVDKHDLITTLIPVGDFQLTRFFLSIGMERVGGVYGPGQVITMHNPPVSSYYHQLQAPQPQVAAFVRSRISK
jgi:predicted GNAT family N-acyltransferase